MQAEKDEYKYLYFHLLRQQHIGFRPLGRNLDHVKFLLCVKFGLLWLIAGVVPHFSRTRCFYFLLETIFLCLFVCLFFFIKMCDFRRCWNKAAEAFNFTYWWRWWWALLLSVAYWNGIVRSRVDVLAVISWACSSLLLPPSWMWLWPDLLLTGLVGCAMSRRTGSRNSSGHSPHLRISTNFLPWSENTLLFSSCVLC